MMNTHYIQLFMNDFGLIHHQLKSVEYFNKHHIIPSVKNNLHFSFSTPFEYSFEIQDVIIQKPKYTPDEYIKRQESYMYSLHIRYKERIVLQDYGVQYKGIIELCKIPCMIGVYPCDEKDHKYSGCFIINGNIRCIVMQETLAWNIPIVTTINDALCECSIRSYVAGSYGSTYSYTILYHRKKDYIYLQLGNVMYSIHDICYYWKTLEDIKENHSHIYEYFSIDNDVPKKREITKESIIFPHCTTISEKYEFLLFSLYKMKSCLQKNVIDDIDDLKNKTIMPPGYMYGSLIRQKILLYRKQMMFQIQKYLKTKQRSIIIQACFTSLHFPKNIISSSIHYAFATGNWNINKTFEESNGICQLVNRTNSYAHLSHLRLVHNPLPKDSKMMKPRQIHPSSIGMLCIHETPESGSVGLLQTLSYFSTITAFDDNNSMKKKLSYVLSSSSSEDYPHIVFLNGIYLGYSHIQYIYPIAPIHSFLDNTFVYVQTQMGTIIRPVLDKHKMKYWNINDNWNSCIERKKIRYISCSCFRVIPDQKSSYSEIDNHMYIHGIMGANIVFAEHNQAPRNIYQTNMGKQAIGSHIDHTEFSLDYPQKPLCITRANQYLNQCTSYEDHTGVNCCVAIMCFSGYNQEDSIVVNKSALDRGLFQTTHHVYYKTKEKTNGNRKEVCISNDISSSPFPKIREKIQKNDIVIQKQSKTDFTRQHAESNSKNISLVHQHNESFYVHEIQTTCIDTSNNYNAITIHGIATRIPEIGDKLSSRHGQKGIIGMIMNDIDMPRTIEGIIPDIIINTHAIPSRMTIGQILESITSRYNAQYGSNIHGTPFQHQDIMQLLKQLPVNNMGEETMYSGITGNPLAHKSFVGITYYQRLKHFVQDKIHARRKGKIDAITKQPVHGRVNNGGLRIGEMEKDAFIAHGTTEMIKERLLDASDGTIAHICKKCGLFVDSVPIFCIKAFCRLCETEEYTTRIYVPNAYILLCKELLCLRIAVKHKLKEYTI